MKQEIPNEDQIADQGLNMLQSDDLRSQEEYIPTQNEIEISESDEYDFKTQHTV